MAGLGSYGAVIDNVMCRGDGGGAAVGTLAHGRMTIAVSCARHLYFLDLLLCIYLQLQDDNIFFMLAVL